jgi:hypothetical protein
MSDDRLAGLDDVLNNELLKRIDPMLPHMGRSRWIVKPDWIPPEIDGLQGIQTLIDRHLVQRLWQLFQDNYTLMKRGMFRTQKPGWIDPPATSEPEDRVSEAGVALSNGTPVTVLSYQVPDVHYAVFRTFGHALDAASQWGVVSWVIQVNKRPVRTYNGFLQQRGAINAPTFLAKPIICGPKALVEVTATGGVTAVNAFARLVGWSIGAAKIVQDGSWDGLQVR